MKTFKLNFLEFVRTKFCIIIYIVVNASMFLSSLYRMFFDTMVPGRLFVLSSTSEISAAGFAEMNLKFAAIIFITVSKAVLSAVWVVCSVLLKTTTFIISII